MRSSNGLAPTLIVGAALLATGAATAPSSVRFTAPVLSGVPALPRPTGATLVPGVARPGGPVPGPGLTRPTGASPGPGVPRAVGPTLGPGVTRPTGATPGPGVFRPTGPIFGPGVERPTGATPGPGVSRPTGAEFGPEVTRPTGATPGPGVPRAAGAIPGPNVERPTGPTPGPGLVRPTGPPFGFTFGPLFQQPFRVDESLPSEVAVHAGTERRDLSTEFPAPPRVLRPDLLTAKPALPRTLRPDLLTETPAPARILRPDLSTERPAPPRDERTDLSTDERTRSLGGLPIPPPGFAPGEPAGGTFTGGIVGGPYAWRLSQEELLGEEEMLGGWRLFDQPGYREDRFAEPPPPMQWGPLARRGWIVSGRASAGPSWSTLRSDQDWAASGRAGYGPDWTALRE